MGKEAALAAANKAIGIPSETGNTSILQGNTAGLNVSSRQARRTLVNPAESQEASMTMSDATKAAQTAGAPAPESIETNPTEQPKGLDSDRFVHLAKKEAKLQREREALAAEKKANAEAKAKYDNVEKQFREFEELKKTDPIAAMKHAGFSNEDIFNFYAKTEADKQAALSPEAKAVAAADARIKEFEDRQTKAAQDAKKKQDDTIIGKFKSNISVAITKNKDKYEYCNHYGPQAEQQLYLNIEHHLNTTGELLSIPEALESLESFYEETDKSMNTLKKRGYKAPEPKEEEVVPPKSKTLSNKVSPTIRSSAAAQQRGENRQEKKQRLMDSIKANGLRK